ncbi:hypothetical protein [Geminisphaera colitermitum]|uniref:hypothetical protein n=1 Tax=Geminisphaera colitermitum TaxID=1148786 RepID=UPI00019654C9|nr:hypothetical protein [Geminisphaera colitermitum]
MKRAIKNNKPKDGNSSRPDIIDVDCIDRQRLAALIERGSCTTDTQATAAFGALLGAIGRMAKENYFDLCEALETALDVSEALHPRRRRRSKSSVVATCHSDRVKVDH